MLSVKEASKLTGISEQNIRYYEKQKLISPTRNSGNAYRQYSEEDIRKLKLILLFRKLDMPVVEIRKLFDGEISLEEALLMQTKHLEDERKKLDAALKFCSLIHESSIADMDVDVYLKKMDEEEKRGSVFAEFLNDYKAVVRSEAKRTFSFMPDAPCRNPREFTDELLKFANKEGLNIVITKESMSPHFEIDGIEYYAYRKGARFGIIVYCEMVHPEDYIPEGMDEKKYYRYRALSIVAFPVLLFTIVILLSRGDLFTTWEGIVAFGAVVVAFLANIYYIFYSYGKNFKG